MPLFYPYPPIAKPNPGGVAGLEPALDRTITDALGRVRAPAFAGIVNLSNHDGYALIDSTPGIVTVTLPTALMVGEVHVIADKSGTSGQNNITVDAGIGMLIDDRQTYVLDGPYESLTVVWTGVFWKIY